MKKNTFVRFMALLLAIAMIIGCGFYLVYIIADTSLPGVYLAYADNSVNTSKSNEDAYKKLDQLKSVIEFISENYKEEISASTLVEGAYDGVFSKLDQWSVYYATKDDEESFTSSLANEEYVGIGVTISKDANQCLIEAVNPRGDAQASGLRYGDVIIKIDGVDCTSWSLDDISNRLRGKENTNVNVTVLRNGAEITYEVTRMKLTASDIYAYIIEGTDIGYIRIAGFSTNVGMDFTLARFQLIEDGAKTFIYDVRDNGGGYMQEAIEAAAAVLDDGCDLIHYVGQEGEVENYKVTGIQLPEHYKTVVLINENTASAAEAFTSCLKENKAATVVGCNSYGKGCAQQIVKIDDNTSYKLSTLFFTGPNNTKIDGVGITPDYIIYNGCGDFEKVFATASNVIPMNEGKKYVNKGDYGLNVFAAQQRLQVLGYSVSVNGYLDEATMTALLKIQKDAGGYPYGALDFFTIKALDEVYNSWLTGDTDAQLNKAISLLK